MERVYRRSATSTRLLLFIHLIPTIMRNNMITLLLLLPLLTMIRNSATSVLPLLLPLPPLQTTTRISTMTTIAPYLTLLLQFVVTHHHHLLHKITTKRSSIRTLLPTMSKTKMMITHDLFNILKITILSLLLLSLPLFLKTMINMMTSLHHILLLDIPKITSLLPLPLPLSRVPLPRLSITTMTMITTTAKRLSRRR